LDRWRRIHGPLDVSADYVQQLESDLRSQYDDPLKRAFVEAMWAGPGESGPATGAVSSPDIGEKSADPAENA